MAVYRATTAWCANQVGLLWKKRSSADTKTRDAARWEFGNMRVPDCQKWRRISKQSAVNIPERGPPDEIMEHPNFHSRHIITIGHMKHRHRSSDATIYTPQKNCCDRQSCHSMQHHWTEWSSSLLPHCEIYYGIFTGNDWQIIAINSNSNSNKLLCSYTGEITVKYSISMQNYNMISQYNL